MRSKLKHLPKPVVQTILSFYYRKRFYELLRALLLPLICFAVVALVATHIDRFLFLDTSERFWLSAITGGATLLTAIFALILFIRRQRSVSHLAYELESLLPKSVAERLVTLHDVLTRDGTTPSGTKNSPVRDALVHQLTQETVALCEETPHAAGLARDQRLKLRTALLSLLALAWLGLLVVPAYQFPLMLQRLICPTRNLPKPSFIRLVVTPASAVIGRGGEVVLQVQVSGAIPRLLQGPMHWLGADPSRCLMATATGTVTRLDIDRTARPISRVQSRLFVTSRNDLQDSFSYRIRCGDAQTDIRLVRVIAQPRATGVYVTMEPPAYTGLKPSRVDDLRDPIPAFSGSKLRLCFGVDQAPLKSVRIVGMRDGSTLAELQADPQNGTYTHELAMSAPVEMELVLVNELGFENVERVRIAFVLREDQSPTVRLEYPGGEISSVQGELVPMHMEFSDDLGLLEGAICYQINANRNPDAPTREIPLPVEEQKLTQTLSSALDLAKVDATPGDEILLWVRVRDTGRNDERSPAVRVHITAFGGNENEHRRLAALRLAGQLLAILEPSTTPPAALVFNETACEPLVNAATAQGLVLPPQPTLNSLLNFLEREHYFTDSAEAASEVRLLCGVIAGHANPPPAPVTSLATQKTALQRLGTDILPALLHERMGRDLIRRTINLRTETLATTSEKDSQQNSRAAVERRVDLLRDAMDTTGDDMAKLARLSPQLLKLEDVLNIKRLISRACLELKRDASRQQIAGKALADQIDAWINLLLPALPAWQSQRLAARAALRTQYEELQSAMNKASLAANPPASVTRWLSTNARMIERSPFLGLAERLPATYPDTARTTTAATQAALSCEAGLLSRLAVDSEFADWTASPRVTPAERQLAAALKALDQAELAADRAAAAEALRTLVMDDETATSNRPPAAAASAPRGLDAQLPVLTSATSLTEAYDKTMESLAQQTGHLQELLAQFNTSGEAADAFPAFAATLTTVEAGLAQWESDCQRLSYRMHLDLTYGDPQREQTPRIAAALPALREAINRYQAFVPPLLLRVKGRLQRRASTENLSALTQDQEQLVRCVTTMGSKLKLTAKQLRGEAQLQERESASMRDTRLYYQTARQLTQANDPAAVAAAFFAKNPAAATLALESRLYLLRDLRKYLRQANEILRTQTAAHPTFVPAMQQAVQCATTFEQQLLRFASLDAEGTVRNTAANVRKRTEALIQPGRDTTTATLPRDRLALDELMRSAAQFENQAGELITKFNPTRPTGWWGGPVGVWDDAGRRDAEHARRRTLAQFERARRAIVLGFDEIITRRGQPGAPLPDEPLASALLAWRTLHSSLGGGTRVVIPPPLTQGKQDALSEWLLKELEETSKSLRQTEGGLRPYQDPTTRWVESAKGLLRY